MVKKAKTKTPKVKRKKKSAKDGGASAPPSKGFPTSKLTDLVNAITKQAGEGTAQRLGSDAFAVKMRGVISTRCETIDAAIGRGGIPFGRLTILHGPESSGKTTLAGQLAAECQAMGGIVVYQDKEYKLDPDYFANLGVNIDDLIVSQPDYLERCLQIMETCILWTVDFRKREKRAVPMLIILDSMNAALCKESYEKGWDEQTIAGEARIYSQKLPKLIEKVSVADVALLFVSQIREKVGVLFGPKESTAGGRAPKFHASLILDIRHKGTVKENDEASGNVCEVYVGKNQIARPFRRGQFVIKYGQGIDYEDSLVRQALTAGHVEQSGSWYNTASGERLGQGLANVADNLRKMTGVRDELRKLIREKYGES